MKVFLISIALLLTVSACVHTPEKPTVETPKQETVTDPIVVPPAQTPVQEEGHVALNWENTDAPHPERSPWSKLALKLVGENLGSFEKAQDLKEVCPRYYSLDTEGRKFALATLIVAVTRYESGYSPTSRMWEKKLEGKMYPIDPITGKYVYSEGLLQLSYQDMQWAPYCKFDWSKDKLLKDTDPKKTILDPLINLECGIQIMAKQVASKKLIFPKYGYWAVMNTGSKYSQVKGIKERVKKYAPKCF